MKVSLFPFLPVLLCMMGAMIMFLVLVAWDVQESAVGLAPEHTVPALTLEEAEDWQYKIEASLEEAEWYADNFSLAKQQADDVLADLQVRLAQAERDTQKLKDEILRLRELTGQIETPSPAGIEEIEYLKSLLAQKQMRQAEAERELAELQQESASNQRVYAIVPSRSPAGTLRRPIYIECKEDKVIIQPEGVELSLKDFQLLDEPANPFDTVLRVIRQYYIETENLARGNEPYPLLLVRPSGVHMFEKTRQATGNWVGEFGFDLLDETGVIQYPDPPNEELRNRISQQLELARNRLNGYLIARRIAAPAVRYGSGYPRQFRMDHRGNVVPTGGEADDRRQSPEGRWTMPNDRGPNDRGPNDRGPNDRGPNDRGPNDRGPNDRGPIEEGNKEGAESRWQMTDGNGNEGEYASLRRGMWEERGRGLNDATVSTNSGMSNSERESDNRDGMGSGMGQNRTVGNEKSTLAEENEQRMPQQPSPQRPQNWALKGASPSATGISRPVRIRCEADRFVLPVQPGIPWEQVFPVSGSVSSAADMLVQAIWEFQESWGSAGSNMYWRPRLQPQTAPGGDFRLYELKGYLKHSGLTIDD